MRIKRSFRRGLPLLLTALLLAALLTGCGGSKPETQPASAAETAQTQEPQTAATALPSDEVQRQVIEANRALWAFEDPYDSPWFYTVADLDHNGLLEILAATTQGTGIFTYAHYYEVLADGSGLKNLYHDGMEIEGPDDWPEVIRDKLDFYYDPADDSYHYLCEGVTREGAAHQYFAWYALCLQKGVAEWELLASKEVEWLDGGETETITCRDAQGNPITEQEYDEAAAERFAGLEKRTAALFWHQVENPFEETAGSLSEGESEPTGEETPVTETPSAPDNNPTFHITKNPTSEALAIGGKTWFIAYADNDTEPTWQLTDPDGQLYSLEAAMDYNPGLRLEALPQGTLAVSDVPLSLNGWGVVARFDGEGGYLYTEPAYLYVGDYVSAYSGVIQRYRAAYESGSRDAGYAMEHELSEIISSSEHVGYARQDLDKNGIPELIVAGIGTDDFSSNMIYDIYTLTDNRPVNLVQSWARNRYYLRTDSLIVNEGSGGAAFSEVYLFAVGADGLTPKEGIITFFPGDDRDSCYHQVGHCDYEPQPGDERISMEEYSAVWDSWKSLCYIPPLTQIA